MFRPKVPRFLKLLYVHNPFYLISACLFIHGLKVWFGPDDLASLTVRPDQVTYLEPWSLMGSLCAVALLMAGTAWAIVRFGKVWEDARSLALVLLLMFLSISVSFDEIVTLASWNDDSVRNAVALLSVGFLFSFGVTEGLLRSLKIRLPWTYRGPFYGLLLLFFAYPLWVSPEVLSVSADQARWRIAAFPMLAGIVALSLLPAVRRGSQSVTDNGTPWKWPWFPWTVFAFLAVAVCFRSWSLAISFDLGKAKYHYWDTSFGLYFLVPFLLPVLFVLLEIGIAENIRKLKDGVLWAAPLLVVVSVPSITPSKGFYTYTRFLDEFTQATASPVFLALIGLAFFYAVAWMRGLKQAEVGVAATLFALIFVEPHSHSIRPDAFQSWPIWVLGVLEVSKGVIHRSSRKALAGAFAISVAAAPLIEQPWAELSRLELAACLHLMVGSMIVIGATIRDAFAVYVRYAGAVGLCAVCLSYLAVGSNEGFGPMTLWCYGLALAVIAFVISRILERFPYVVAGVLNLIGAVSSTSLSGLEHVREISIPHGMKPLLWGVACFALAVLISAMKGGLADRLHSRLSQPDQASPGGDG